MLYHVCHKKHKIPTNFARVMCIMNNNKSFKSRQIDFYKLFATWSINTCGLIRAFLFNKMPFVFLKAYIFFIYTLISSFLLLIYFKLLDLRYFASSLSSCSAISSFSYSSYFGLWIKRRFVVFAHIKAQWISILKSLYTLGTRCTFCDWRI